MTTSIVGGLIANKFPAKIIACDPSDTQRESIANHIGTDNIHLSADNSVVTDADIIVLAVKPQIMKLVCEPLAKLIKPDTLIISIAAGISGSSLQGWLGNLPIVRCMPNTPALIQKGATGLYANAHCTEDQRNLANNILSAVGSTHWVNEEKHIDAVTAVSGSGPAYFFLFTELMTKVGTEMGLDPDVAEQLAVDTCVGAGMLAQQSDQALSKLRENVTSKGGTTAAALERFDSDDLETIVRHAMVDCQNRASAMAKEFGS